jgi:Putative inner membrane protein (DUF1819)
VSGLNSNIVKGGALVDDIARFVEAWEDSLTGNEILDRVADENLLGLPTQSRAADVARYVLRPRFVLPGADVRDGLRALLHNRPAFVDACLYEATRADELLGLFAQSAVHDWHVAGQLEVDVDLVMDWLDGLIDEGSIPSWSESLKRRVAQGLIATLRDFGRLCGTRKSPRKEIPRPGISIGGFAYVAYRLHQQGESSRGILSSNVWRRWLLDATRVDDLMHRLGSVGIVFFSVAGSSLRIDWRVDSLGEVARAAV